MTEVQKFNASTTPPDALDQLIATLERVFRSTKWEYQPANHAHGWSVRVSGGKPVKRQ